MNAICEMVEKANTRIRQPDMQRKHGTLSRTTNEHQYQRSGQNETSGSHSLRCITSDEWSRTLSHLQIFHKREAERLGVISKDENTDQEEEVGKTGNNKCLLGGCHRCMQGIIESNEQI